MLHGFDSIRPGRREERGVSTLAWRLLLVSFVIGLLLATVPPARADYPAELELELRREMTLALEGLEFPTSFRACLLTPEEALVEIAIPAPGPGVPGPGAAAPVQARQAVSALVDRRFPGMRLSELSSFVLRAPPPSPNVLAMTHGH